jgi:hypothetical protein
MPQAPSSLVEMTVLSFYLDLDDDMRRAIEESKRQMTLDANKRTGRSTTSSSNDNNDLTAQEYLFII